MIAFRQKYAFGTARLGFGITVGLDLIMSLLGQAWLATNFGSSPRIQVGYFVLGAKGCFCIFVLCQA